jgi:hypothetical protein
LFADLLLKRGFTKIRKLLIRNRSCKSLILKKMN